MCPVNTNTQFHDESLGRSSQPIFLYTVYDYDGASNNLYFAAYDIDVVFDGITYQKFPITHSEIGENTKGEVDTIKVQVSNVSRLIEAYLQMYDLRGKKVSIKMVFANQLDDPDCCIEFSDFIDSYTSNIKDVVFVLMSKFDLLGVTIPKMIYLRDYCQWIFKGTQCAYSGSATTCNKTWARCKELGNSLRFIGFRNIPDRRGYV